MERADQRPASHGRSRNQREARRDCNNPALCGNEWHGIHNSRCVAGHHQRHRIHHIVHQCHRCLFANQLRRSQRHPANRAQLECHHRRDHRDPHGCHGQQHGCFGASDKYLGKRDGESHLHHCKSIAVDQRSCLRALACDWSSGLFPQRQRLIQPHTQLLQLKHKRGHSRIQRHSHRSRPWIDHTHGQPSR